MGEEARQEIAKTPLPVLVEVALETGAELFHGQGGLEVDRDADRPLLQGLHDGEAHQERDRPADPEVGEEHLPHPALDHRRAPSFPVESAAEILRRRQGGIDSRSLAAKGGQADISEAHPLHRLGPFDLRDDERNEGRPEFGHGMPEGSRHPVSVAGGAGRRPGGAAGRQDDGTGGIGSFFRPDSFDAAIAKGDPRYRDTRQ